MTRSARGDPGRQRPGPGPTPAEKKARRTADSLAGRAGAVLRLQTMVGNSAVQRLISRGGGDSGTTDVPEEEQLRAGAWVDRNGPTLIPAVRTQLQAVDLPTQLPFVTWAKGNSADFVTAVLDAALPPSSGAWKRIVDLSAPASPIAPVDRTRGVDPGGTGPPAYEPKEVDTLHGLLVPKLGDSVKRMLRRYVIAANQAALREELKTKANPAVAPEPPLADVPVSSPFDTPVRAALATRVRIDFAEFRKANPAEANPHDIAHLRPVTGIVFALEEPVSQKGVANWLKVAEPAGATAEEVAAVIYGDPAAAPFVTAASPHFGFDEKRLVPDLKARWDKAAKTAGFTADPSGITDPSAQALTGPLADVVAKAQAAGIKPTGASPDDIAQRMRSAHALVGDMKAALTGKPALAGQGALLDPLIARLDARSKEVKAAPDQAATWDGQSAGQLGVITSAAEGVRLAVGAAGAFSAEKASAEPAVQAELARTRAPLLELTRAFVDAAAVSDLVGSGQTKLAAARAQLTVFPVAVSEAVLATVEGVIANATASKSVSEAALKDIREKAASVRGKLLKVRDLLVTDPAGAKTLIESAENELFLLRTQATLVTNMDACDKAIKALDAAIGPNPVVSGVAQTAPRYIAAKKDMAEWYDTWNQIYTMWSSGNVVKMGQAEGLLKKFTTDPAWVGKFESIRTLISDGAVQERWVGVAVMVGIAAVSAGAGAMVGGGLLGFGVEAAAFSAMSTALLEKDPTVGGLLAGFGTNVVTLGAMRAFSGGFAAVLGEKFAKSAVGQGVQLLTIAGGTAAVRLAAADSAAKAAGAKGVDEASAREIVVLTFLEALAMAVGQHVGKQMFAGSPVRNTAGLKERFAALDATDAQLRIAADTLRDQAAAQANVSVKPAGAAAELTTKAKKLVTDEGAALEKKQEVVGEIKKKLDAGEKVEGITPEQAAAVQAGLAKQANAAKLAKVMLEVKEAGPGRYLCDGGKLEGIRTQLLEVGYKETGTSVDPVTQAKTSTFSAPEGGEGLTITETKGIAAKAAEAVLPPISEGGAIWEGGNQDRGLGIETALGKIYRRMMGGSRRMPKDFKGIDFTAGGEVEVVTDAKGNRVKEIITGADGISEKSMDLRSDKGGPRDYKSVKSGLSKHLDALYAFESYELSGVEVKSLRSKILNVSVGPGEPTADQWRAINDIIGLAAHNNIMVNVMKF